MSLKSPLSRAVGLGSAKHGFSHWWWQRVTAIALVPLCFWFVYSVICLVGGTHTAAAAWLSSPINAALMLLFVYTSLYHGQTGMQVIVEDYVHSKWLNISLLLLMKFAAVLLAVFASISVMQVVLGG